jgi:signal transduction histidine kinase
MHQDDRDRTNKRAERASARGEPFFAEYRMHASDGTEVWIRDEAVPVIGDDGKPAYWRGVMLDITEVKRAEARLRRGLALLERSTEERNLLLGRLEQAREQERRRIAADIHDDSIQVMAAVSLRLQVMYEDVKPERREDMEDLGNTVNEAIERLRYLVFELRPPALDTDGLAPALNEYLSQVSGQAGFTFRIHDETTVEPSLESRIVLYRVAQEAIANIRKHAKARRVQVYLETEGDGVRVRIVDDGEGFDMAITDHPEPGHVGLLAMRERAELLGGQWTLDSTPGVGTTVDYWLPAEIKPDEPPAPVEAVPDFGLPDAPAASGDASGGDAAGVEG